MGFLAFIVLGTNAWALPKICLEVMRADWESSLYSRRLTAIVPPAEAIIKGDYYKWTQEELRRNSKIVYNMLDDSPTLKPQEILLLEDFSKREQALIGLLTKLAHHPKFTRRTAPEALLRYRRLGEPFVVEGEYSKQEIEGVAQEFADDKISEGVEVGAFRIVLKDGRVFTAVHTSSENLKIMGDHAAAALRGLAKFLNGIAVPPQNVALLQFFHSHPFLGCLSDGDFGHLNWMKEIMRSHGVSTPVHIYAIVNSRKPTLVFHAGLQ